MQCWLDSYSDAIFMERNCKLNPTWWSAEEICHAFYCLRWELIVMYTVRRLVNQRVEKNVFVNKAVMKLETTRPWRGAMKHTYIMDQWGKTRQLRRDQSEPIELSMSKWSKEYFCQCSLILSDIALYVLADTGIKSLDANASVKSAKLREGSCIKVIFNLKLKLNISSLPSKRRCSN